MAEYKLELKGISKSFPGVKALDNVQLSLRPGTVHALMGENGAGKSTLMKCLFGIYKMDAGEIYLDGQRIQISNPDEAMKHGIAMVHQELPACSGKKRCGESVSWKISNEKFRSAKGDRPQDDVCGNGEVAKGS